MAKKRNPGIVESGAQGTGTAAARARRRSVKNGNPETAVLAQPVAGAEDGDASLPAVPTNEEIARLAYSYWLARGRQGGSPEEDWLRAEKELSARA